MTEWKGRKIRELSRDYRVKELSCRREQRNMVVAGRKIRVHRRFFKRIEYFK